GTITHYEGIVLDITERKQVEEALKESEHRNAMLIRAIPDMMFVISSDGVYRDVRVPNDAALALPADRIIGTNIRDSGFGEESTDTILYHLGMALETNKLQLFEYELVLPQGLRQYEARVVALSNQEVLGIIRDITERKAMETALSLSQQTYRSYVDNSPVGIFVAESSGQYLDVNDAALRLLGYSHEEMMSMTILDLALPDERQQTLDLFTRIQERLKTEPSVSVELRLRKKDGSDCPVIMSTVRLPNDTILGFTLDISERKAAEDALRESRQLFVDIISFLPDPTFVIDSDGVVVAWNRAIEELSGVPAAEMIGKGDHEYSLWLYGIRRPILIDLVLHPDPDAGRMNYTGIHKEGHTITAETRIRSPKSDRPVTLSLVASPLIDSQGTVTGAIESMRDISRLKEAEADLARINQNLELMVKDRTRALEEEVAQRREAEKNVQASLDYTRSVIEANPDLMVVLDKNGIILDVNTAGEMLTGITKDQLIGTPYFGYLVEDGTVQSAFAGLLEKGRIENLVRIQRIDGHITPLSVHATVIRGREGSNDRIIVAAHDITRQKQDEDAIRASLEEKVVLLREIHHRVKNNLQIIISLTNLQMRQTNDPAIKQIISETQNRVRAMSLVHEKLYRSTSLSRIDFADYTRFLATQLISYFGTDTRRVKLDFAMEEIMVDINTAVPLGLLMNELVSNALKHAFPDGREGTIGISGTTGEDQITLVVRDDGIGMPPDLDWKNTASLGMRLVTSLVDQVNGTITLDAGSGTAWTVTVHKGPEGDREVKE
ncbi:MAG TPA: PAS domain S-box protein, partial [Methanoregula sp.]|nr:PAS domain S-box protein [Methanoregula sp.]